MPHTPGPWTTRTQSASYIDIAGNPVDAISARIPTARPGEIASTCVCRVHRQYAGEANAQLIAAAPDLLEALQEALHYFIGEHSRDHPTTRMMEAAIVKAVGAQS